MDDQTCPGWTLSLIWSVQLILAIFLFKEPANIAAHLDKPSPVIKVPCATVAKVSVLLLMLFISTICLASLEAAFSPIGDGEWGWSEVQVGFALGGVAAVAVMGSLLVMQIRSYLNLQDRCLMAVTAACSIAPIIILFQYGDDYYYPQFIVGAAVFLAWYIPLKSAIISLLSKIVPKNGFLGPCPFDSRVVVLLVSIFSILAKGLAPLFGSNSFSMGINVFIGVMFALWTFVCILLLPMWYGLAPVKTSYDSTLKS